MLKGIKDLRIRVEKWRRTRKTESHKMEANPITKNKLKGYSFGGISLNVFFGHFFKKRSIEEIMINAWII